MDPDVADDHIFNYSAGRLDEVQYLETLSTLTT
jgi:hypothetical protein